jgi:hypothetical protein
MEWRILSQSSPCLAWATTIATRTQAEAVRLPLSSLNTSSKRSAAVMCESTQPTNSKFLLQH